ncbi:hypothetical protein [Novipirellula aureliae]
MVDPRGLGTTAPRFFWQVASDKNEVVQTSFPRIVATSESLIEENTDDSTCLKFRSTSSRFG